MNAAAIVIALEAKLVKILQAIVRQNAILILIAIPHIIIVLWIRHVYQTVLTMPAAGMVSWMIARKAKNVHLHMIV